MAADISFCKNDMFVWCKLKTVQQIFESWVHAISFEFMSTTFRDNVYSYEN